ncbi:MAG: flagellar basal body protein, partial [Candidatus Poribacteria bacterium]
MDRGLLSFSFDGRRRMSSLNSLGLFSSLNLGRRAVQSQTAGLQITGRNIANVNTPGYTR